LLILPLLSKNQKEFGLLKVFLQIFNFVKPYIFNFIISAPTIKISHFHSSFL
jgi:hypothetical protein